MTDTQFEEIKKLLQKNIDLTKENLEMSRKLRHYQILGSIWGWTKLLILIFTLLAGFVYLPKFAQRKINELYLHIQGGGANSFLQKLGIEESWKPENVLKNFRGQ